MTCFNIDHFVDSTALDVDSKPHPHQGGRKGTPVLDKYSVVWKEGVHYGFNGQVVGLIELTLSSSPSKDTRPVMWYVSKYMLEMFLDHPRFNQMTDDTSILTAKDSSLYTSYTVLLYILPQDPCSPQDEYHNLYNLTSLGQHPSDHTDQADPPTRAKQPGIAISTEARYYFKTDHILPWPSRE